MAAAAADEVKGAHIQKKQRTGASHLDAPFDELKTPLTEWISELSIQEVASEEREAVLVQNDSAQIIARELTFHGVRMHHSVEAALQHMTKKQDEKDTIELALTMKELPQQWSSYRILLQHSAQEYFKNNLNEDPNFMTIYFKSITFTTLWNDVWMKHFSIPGGRHVALLARIQKKMTDLDNPSEKEAEAHMKAIIRRSNEILPFSPAELQLIKKTIIECIDTQHQQETQLKEEMLQRSTSLQHMHLWINKIIPLATKAITEPTGASITFTDFGSDTAGKPRGEIMRMINESCTYYASKEIKERQEVLTRSLRVVAEDRETTRTAFLKELNDDAWKNAYKQYVVSTLQWQTAQRVAVFLHSLQNEPNLAADVGLVKSLSEVQQSLNAEYVARLFAKRADKCNKLEIAQQQLVETATKHAFHNYMLFTMQLWNAIAMNVDDPNADEKITKLLLDTAKADNAYARVKGDMNTDSPRISDPFNHCRCLLDIKTKKAELIVAVLKGDIGDSTKDDVITKAVTFCQFFIVTMQKDKNAEVEQHTKLREELLQRQQSPSIIASLHRASASHDLFTRQMMPFHANKGRAKFKAPMHELQGSDIVGRMLRVQQLHLPISTEDLDDNVRFAEAHTSASFADFAALLLWVSWVKHQYKIFSTPPKLATDVQY